MSQKESSALSIAPETQTLDLPKSKYFTRVTPLALYTRSRRRVFCMLHYPLF